MSSNISKRIRLQRVNVKNERLLVSHLAGTDDAIVDAKVLAKYVAAQQKARRRWLFFVSSALSVATILLVAGFFLIPPLLQRESQLNNPTPMATVEALSPVEQTTLSIQMGEPVQEGESIRWPIQILDEQNQPVADQVVQFSLMPSNVGQLETARMKTDANGRVTAYVLGLQTNNIELSVALPEYPDVEIKTVAIPENLLPQADVKVMLVNETLTAVQNEVITVQFVVWNDGAVAENQGQLFSKLPENTRLIESDQCQMAETPDQIMCELAPIRTNGMKIEPRFQIEVLTSGVITLTPADFYIQDSNQNQINGEGEWMVTVSPLELSFIRIEAQSVEMAADLQSSASITVTLGDQNGKLFADSSEVSLTLTNTLGITDVGTLSPYAAVTDTGILTATYTAGNSIALVDLIVQSAELDAQSIQFTLYQTRTMSIATPRHLFKNPEADQNDWEIVVFRPLPSAPIFVYPERNELFVRIAMHAWLPDESLVETGNGFATIVAKTGVVFVGDVLDTEQSIPFSETDSGKNYEQSLGPGASGTIVPILGQQDGYTQVRIDGWIIANP